MTTKMVRLRSSDGQELEVMEEAIAAASKTIKDTLEKGGAADGAIPVPGVIGRVLSHVLEYVNRHFSDPGAAADPFDHIPNFDDPFKAFDDAFVQVDQDTLFDLIHAAECLDIEGLMDLTCETVADQMRGKTIEEIRKKFHVINDYTAREEEDVRKENAWAFE
ncbi:SKP1-like protein 1A [Triticum aestivum]|uniref:SKP1-like protein 1A n=1 Tax=Triticum aestivum TaxID=4565 RepID=UPI001D01AD73|nr:SKP1-like protein 1A [Triticum aestivum]